MSTPLINLATSTGAPDFGRQSGAGPFAITCVNHVIHRGQPRTFVLTTGTIGTTCPKGIHFVVRKGKSVSTFSSVVVGQCKLRRIVRHQTLSTPITRACQSTSTLLVSSVGRNVALADVRTVDTNIPIVSTGMKSRRALVPPGKLYHHVASGFMRSTGSTLSRVLGGRRSHEGL